MLRRLKIAVLSLAGLVALSATVYALALRATQGVQPFYVAALRTEPEELESAGRRLEHRVSALYGDARSTSRWQTVFTDDEVNGWLAVILKEKYADLLPPEVSDPRVAFSDGVCKVGYRYQGKRFDTVISVEGEAFMASKDLAAIRLRSAWAGALPLPMSSVIEEISAAAVKLELPLRWGRQEEYPVLLLPLATALSTDDEQRHLERLDVRDGELLLAGSIEPQPKTVSRVVRRVEGGGGR